MDGEKERKFTTNLKLCCCPVKRSCLLKMFVRRSEQHNTEKLWYRSKGVISSLTAPKTNVCPHSLVVWSLFPRVYASEPKKVFSLEQSEESGMDRLKSMFRTTEHGHLSPELHIVTNTIGLAAFMGAGIGGVIASRTAVETVVRQYQSAVFNSQFEGKRKFQDRITLILAGSAFRWAWRVAFFSGTYATIVVTATVYNNKPSIWDHIAAGALTGGMWKLKMGLRATAVGGGLGGILGLFSGCMCACLLWLSGTSIEEMRYWHHDYWEREYRRQVKEMKAKNPDNITEVLAMEHDEVVQDQKMPLLEKNSS